MIRKLSVTARIMLHFISSENQQHNWYITFNAAHTWMIGFTETRYGIFDIQDIMPRGSFDRNV